MMWLRLWRKWRGVSREDEQGPPRLWARILGGVWVVGWLIWTTPMWVYPGLRAAARVTGNKGEFLPFSVVGWIKSLFSGAK